MKTTGLIFIVGGLLLIYLVLSGKLPKLMQDLKSTNADEQHVIHVWAAFFMLAILALMIAPIPKVGSAFMLIVAGVMVNMLIQHASTNTNPNAGKGYSGTNKAT